jgi:diacylglycerol O-acyltransferase / wax synthase
MRKIRAQMTQRREEPARDIIGFIAHLLSVLPTPVLDTFSGAVGHWDVVASNVPSYEGDIYIAGAKVLRQYGLNSRRGNGMAVFLLSACGWCTIMVRYDRAAVRDEKLFAQCLLEGFDEILALAGEPAARAAPASFTLDGMGDELLKKIASDAN